MRRQLAGRHHVDIGNDHVAGTVVADADNRTVLHRFLCQVAHTLAGSFTIEILAFQLRQRQANLLYFRNGRQCFALIVHKLGNVNGDVSTVAFCPSFLPEVTSNLCNLINHGLQSIAAF